MSEPDPFATVVPFPVDDFTLPDQGSEYSCETCGKSLTYKGRGRHPRFCEDHRGGRSKGTGATGVSKRRAPKGPPPGLVSTASLAWGGAGYVMQLRAQTAGQLAAGNMMQLQAPDAGKRIAKILDPYMSKWSWLRALAGTAGPVGDIGMLLAPPIMAFVLAERPDIVEIVRPVLGTFIAPIAEGFLRAQQEQARTLQKMTQQDAEVAEATQQILDMVFGGATRGSDSEAGSGQGAEYGDMGTGTHVGRNDAV